MQNKKMNLYVKHALQFSVDLKISDSCYMKKAINY